MGLPFNADTRYDRQVRLWGEEGQESISATSVCIFGSDSLGTEVLKSLVLAGINSFFIVDDARVDISDLGQNFFLESEDIGKSRASATLKNLIELNSSVTGMFSSESPLSLPQADFERVCACSVVIAVNQREDVEEQFSKVLHKLGVPMVCVKTYGLMGTIKVHIKEHTIANSHEENPKPDLRLDDPFDELEAVLQEINLNAMTAEELRHTPYIFLYLKALEIFRMTKNDQSVFPTKYSEKQEIRKILDQIRDGFEILNGKEPENFEEAKAAVNRSFQINQIDSCVKNILADKECQTSKQPFWIICEALRRFIEAHDGQLPHRGTLPDMTSDTKSYTRLCSIFHEKAQSDARKVLYLTRIVEQERGVGNLISEEMCARFCKNADRIRLQRGNEVAYDQEIKGIVNAIVEKINTGQYENSSVVGCEVWLLLLRAAERFRREKGRFPGTNGVPVPIDGQDLKKRVEALVNGSAKDHDDAVKVLQYVPETAILEMCRYGATEVHVISAFIGGITAQEVIKLATNQYVPIDNTFVFDGHSQESVILQL